MIYLSVVVLIGARTLQKRWWYIASHNYRNADKTDDSGLPPVESWFGGERTKLSECTQLKHEIRQTTTGSVIPAATNDLGPSGLQKPPLVEVCSLKIFGQENFSTLEIPFSDAV